MPWPAAAVVALACRLADPTIDESSGAAAAPAAVAGAWFVTHNDSGDDPRFFAVDRSCRTVGVWRVGNATAVDWEDMAAGPNGTLWFGDIGDNRARRETVTLYRVDTTGLPPGGGTVDAVRVDLRYEDGPHDAETLLVHPADGRVWVVTKSRGGDAGVYEAGDGGVLRRVAALTLDVGGATGGDIAPDGAKVVIRTYLAAYEWRLDGDMGAALTGPASSTELGAIEQGEAIAYVDGGRTLLTTAEAPGAPVRTFPSRVPGGAGDAAPPPTGAPEPLEPPEPAGDGDDLPWWALAAGAAALAGAVAALVARARSRGE